MTTQALAHALKKKKPAVIKENGSPRFVVLDWKTYSMWQEMREDLEDSARLMEALTDPKNQKRTSLSEVRKTLHLS